MCRPDFAQEKDRFVEEKMRRSAFDDDLLDSRIVNDGIPVEVGEERELLPEEESCKENGFGLEFGDFRV